MKLRQSLFWDANLKTLDLQKHQKQIIERTIMRGSFEEFNSLIAYYGLETIKEVVLHARYLDKYTLAFCTTLFDTPKTEFRCYKLAQLYPSHWDF